MHSESESLTHKKLKNLKIVSKSWLEGDKMMTVEETNEKTGVQSTWKYVKVT